MKNKYVKIAVFTALGLGALYGGYKLYKFATRDNKPNDEKPNNEGNSTSSTPTSSSNIGNTSTATTTKKSKFNPNRVVKKGSKDGSGQTEVGAIQIALNNIIEDAKKSKPTTGDKESRRKALANLTPLVVDGIFGSKTEANLSKVLGKKSASYSEVKQKRIDWANAYGLKNPYVK